MAYPPPPGLSSLPSRPPAPGSGTSTPTPAASAIVSPPASSSLWSPPTTFAPAFSSTPTTTTTSKPPSTLGGPPGRTQYGAPPTTYGVSAPPTRYGAPPSYNGGGGQYQSHGTYSRGPSSGSVPHIHNPFPAPNMAAAQANEYDPEMAAAIATWQSAYVSNANTNTTDSTTPGYNATYPADDSYGANSTAADGTTERKKTVAREGGGKKWTDDSLLEWDPTHLRIFVGNLGGETTDNSLLGAFSRWSSVQKARVIRDKRTNKSKGYGFVSFSDADDFFSAAKEMNGKYIGSHPVVIRKANTEIKVVKAKDKDGGGYQNGKWRNKNNKKSGSGGGDDKADAFEPSLGPVNPGRVTKPGQKTKNGLRLLG